MNQSAKIGAGVGLALVALIGLAALMLGDDEPAPALPTAGGTLAADPRPGGTLAPDRRTTRPTAAPTPGATPSAAPTQAPSSDPRAQPVQLVVRGRVVDSGGAPLAKASVVLWLAAAAETGVQDNSGAGGAARSANLFALRAVGRVPFDVARGQSGAGGVFSLGPLAIRPTPGARLNLSAEVTNPEGETRIATTTVVLPAALPAGGVDAGDVVLEKLPALRFLVRARGAPLEGAKVVVRTEVVPPGWSAAFPRPQEQTLTTDVQGRAGHATGAPRVAFSISADGYATEHGVARLRPEGIRVSVDLDPQAQVEGIVVDSQGRPAPSARLQAYEDGGGSETGFKAASETLRWVRRSGSAVADDQGRFVLPGMGAKRKYWVYALPPGSDPSLLHSALAVTPPKRDLRLTLAQAATLTVQAQLPPDAERPARISFVLQRKLAVGWQDQFLQHVGPDRPLKLTFARIPPGTLRVALHAPGFAPVVSEPMEVRAGTAPPPLTLSLRSRGRSLSGRVIDAASRPLPGATVVWRDYGVLYAVTDGEGRFSLANLPVDPLVLTVQLPGYKAQTVEVSAGTTTVPSIALQPAR